MKNSLIRSYLLVYKAINSSGKKYISDHLIQNKPLRSLRSLETGLFSVPRVKTKHGEVAFSFYVPNKCRKLPENIRSAETLRSFKLETHLFTAALYENILMNHFNMYFTVELCTATFILKYVFIYFNLFYCHFILVFLLEPKVFSLIYVNCFILMCLMCWPFQWSFVFLCVAHLITLLP